MTFVLPDNIQQIVPTIALIAMLPSLGVAVAYRTTASLKWLWLCVAVYVVVFYYPALGFLSGHRPSGSVPTAAFAAVLSVYWMLPVVFACTMTLIVAVLAWALRNASLLVYAAALLAFGSLQLLVPLGEVQAATGYEIAWNTQVPLAYFALLFAWFGITYLELTSSMRAQTGLLASFLASIALREVGTRVVPGNHVDSALYLSWAVVFVAVGVLAAVKARSGFRPAPYLAIGSFGLAASWLTGAAALQSLEGAVGPGFHWQTFPWFTAGLIWQGVFVFVSIADGVVAANREALIAKTKLAEELQRYNDAFRRFVPREFLEYLERENIAAVELGDQKRSEMSILFSDIRDFTALSERMSPQENFTFLNSYLGRIGPLVREHGGFIDKYIGDAIMGLFPTKAQHALSAAIALQEEVRRFNRDRAAAGEEGIKIGIGLHRGWLMLGTIGESERMDTTVIADAVNLASRLEGLTKVFGVGLIVSEAIVQGLDDASAFHFRSLGAVRPKGKSESCEIFEVYDGDLPSVFEEKEKSSSLFAGAVAEFRAGKFASAERTFGELAAAAPADGAAAHFRDRCTELKTQTGVERWDGVERFEFK